MRVLLLAVLCALACPVGGDDVSSADGAGAEQSAAAPVPPTQTPAEWVAEQQSRAAAAERQGPGPAKASHCGSRTVGESLGGPAGRRPAPSISSSFQAGSFLERPRAPGRHAARVPYA